MKTAVIVGRSSRTRDFAPFNKEVDIYALSLTGHRLPRCTAAIEMHPEILDEGYYEQHDDIGEYRAWLRKTRTPIYMHKYRIDVPHSLTYPRDRIEKKYGGGFWKGEQEMRTLFGGSTSYALPLLMFLGYERIELYGVELAKPEYAEDRDLTFLWIGRATASGIEVTIHENSRLTQEVLYPFTEVP